MKVTITDQPQCKKELRFEIPGDVVRAETDKVAANLSKQVNVPGFRRGHVPKSVVKTRFKKELRDEVLSHLIPDSLGHAIKEHDLKVLGQPSVSEMSFRDDETIDLVVTVDVAPAFELSNYKALPLRKRIYKVSDEDVDKAINRMRDAHAQLVPVEGRPAQTGDIVSASIARRILNDPSGDEPKPETDSPRDDVEIELGGRGVMQEFTDAFTGASASETRQFEVEYPSDYKPEQFAGRRVEYTAEVTAVRARELPELDDDFAKTVGEEFASIQELRQKLRTNLEHQAEHRTEEEFNTAVMDQLIDRNRFDVPDVVVDQQIDARMRQLFRQLSAQGMDPRTLKLDWDALRESHRERAVREVRGAFILDRIAEAEKTEVSDEEIDKDVEVMAQGLGQSVESVKSRLTQDGSIDRLREQVRNRKALESVIASADMKIEEVPGMGDSNASGQPA